MAEWIGEYLQDALGFPDQADQRAEPGTGWTPPELNHLLQAHVVDGAALSTLCVWNGSQICAGASCVPDVIQLICQNTTSMKCAWNESTGIYTYSVQTCTYTSLTCTYLVCTLYMQCS